MQDHSESVMIALLPNNPFWSKLEIPHLTLVYAGEIKDLRPSAFNELAKDAAMLAMLTRPFRLFVRGRERFGQNQEVDVFTLQPTPELWAMRRAVENWNASEFSFNPHVTIGPTGTPVEEVPRVIGFDRIMVSWGGERLTFWLRTYD